VTLEDDTGIGQFAEDDYDADAIDINDDEDLRRNGLTRCRVEPGGEEYLLDQQGNIFNL